MQFNDQQKEYNYLSEYWIGNSVFRDNICPIGDASGCQMIILETDISVQKDGLKSCFFAWKYIFPSVPQGPGLEPLLCLLYINDIAKHHISWTRLFTGDSSLLTL